MGYEKGMMAEFCRSFISSISLYLKLAGSNLLNTLFTLPKPQRTNHFCEVCLKEPKRAAILIEPFPYNHNISDILAGLNNTNKEILLKSKPKSSILTKFFSSFAKQ